MKEIIGENEAKKTTNKLKKKKVFPFLSFLSFFFFSYQFKMTINNLAIKSSIGIQSSLMVNYLI
jgi:hypothetical protein